VATRSEPWAPTGTPTLRGTTARVRAGTHAHKHLHVGVDGQLPQAPVAQSHHHYGVRVTGVGLAALPDVEHPGPSGQLRRHVQHPLPVGEHSLRDGPAHPVAALDRAHPVRPLMGDLQHAAVTASVGAERPLTYRVAGADGPVIVLVHGVAGCSSTWEPVMERLAVAARAVAPDLMRQVGQAAR
jgi:hypothetical protein